MANTKISQLTNLTTPTWSEEFVYAYNNANGKVTLNTMKSFVWWAGITTLNADANIWELTDGIYETTYDLYYKTWEKVPVIWTASSTKKQMIFVTKESTGEIGYLVFNVGHKNTNYVGRASFGYSISSSVGVCYELKSWEAPLNAFGNGVYASSTSVSYLDSSILTELIEWIDDSTNEIGISTQNPPYPWVTYTKIINSVASGKTYTITLWTWVTNPLGITLPTASNKKCVITLVPTSTTTAIVTWCTIES